MFGRSSAHVETTASVASSSEISLQEPGAGKKPQSKKDKITGGVNLKKSIAKKTNRKDAENNSELEALNFMIMPAVSDQFQEPRQPGRLEVPPQTPPPLTVRPPK